MRALTAIALLVICGTYPNIEGESAWGKVTQNGRGVSVNGNVWEALGRIQDDGQLYLLWNYKATGRKGPALYRIEGGTVEGLWGWEDEVRVDNGKLVGLVKTDTLYAGK